MIFGFVISPNVELVDVEGIPVSLGNMPGPAPVCVAWDTFPPRRFPLDPARRNGAPISPEECNRLLTGEPVMAKSFPERTRDEFLYSQKRAALMAPGSDSSNLEKRV